MHIERNKDKTRTITVQADEAVMIFHKDGVTFDGLNPRELARKPEEFQKLLEMAPHLCNWFDCAEMVHARTTSGDTEPWDRLNDFDARN